MSQTIDLSLITGFMHLVNTDDNTIDTLKLNKVISTTDNNQEYKVIGYDKNFLNVNLVSTYGLCRSVIVNSNNQVVCFSPPKSISSENFIKNNSSMENVTAMEFVEGTMINVFWDPVVGVTGGWQIATRNTVGATSSFFKNKQSMTFRDMFLEAVKENNLNIEGLNKAVSYSFVLQHPMNRIVVPFKTPQLYLVACYTITQTTTQVLVKMHSIVDIMMQAEWANTSIKFPQFYDFNSYTELIQKYASMNASYDIVGVILYNNATCERTKIRNPVYEEVKALRGNQPKLQYQYLCLRQEGKVGEHLTYYPENKKDFSQFRDQVHTFTNTLYRNYVSCYIKKEQPLSQFSHQFKSHMFQLHQLYLNKLRSENDYVTNTVVIAYVNKLHPSILMYCLNFHMRKRVVDFISADTNL